MMQFCSTSLATFGPRPVGHWLHFFQVKDDGRKHCEGRALCPSEWSRLHIAHDGRKVCALPFGPRPVGHWLHFFQVKEGNCEGRALLVVLVVREEHFCPVKEARPVHCEGRALPVKEAMPTMGGRKASSLWRKSTGGCFVHILVVHFCPVKEAMPTMGVHCEGRAHNHAHHGSWLWRKSTLGCVGWREEHFCPVKEARPVHCEGRALPVKEAMPTMGVHCEGRAHNHAHHGSSLWRKSTLGCVGWREEHFCPVKEAMPTTGKEGQFIAKEEHSAQVKTPHPVNGAMCTTSSEHFCPSRRSVGFHWILPKWNTKWMHTLPLISLEDAVHILMDDAVLLTPALQLN
jgi:hypothetical protein